MPKKTPSPIQIELFADFREEVGIELDTLQMVADNPATYGQTKFLALAKIATYRDSIAILRKLVYGEEDGNVVDDR
jgi:hypothetical protein